MKFFAKIDDSNIVLRVDPVEDSVATDEAAGQAYLETHSGWPADKWIETSFDTKRNTHLKGGTPFRGNFAGTGMSWDSANQIFWPQKPTTFPSRAKDLTTADWEAPAGLPPSIDDAEKLTHFQKWNEEDGTWDKTEFNPPIPQADYDAAEDKDEILGRKR